MKTAEGRRRVNGSATDWGERTAADVAGLLVELGRLLKAAGYYGPEAAETSSLAQRATRAWQADLARAGPLELEVGEEGFSVPGLAGPFTAPLGDVAGELRRVAVQRIRFTEVLSRDSLLAFARSLATLDERPASQIGIEVDGEVCWVLGDSDPSTTATQEMRLSENALGNALLGGRGAPAPPSPTPEPSEGVNEPKPDPGTEPLAAAAGPVASRLVGLLQDLDACADDDPYIQLARRVGDEARTLSDQGLEEDATRAVLLLADHAVGEGGRSGVQARVARATLVELASGERLAELIDRACSRDPEASVRAAQVLLTLGEHAVPALLERLEDDGGEPGVAGMDDRSGQLIGLLIAIGEAAVPALTASMSAGTGPRAQRAVQIAGDLQCPSLVRPLRDLLCARGGALQREAARALVEMGSSAALRALHEALESKDERAAEVAAFSLGTLASTRSFPALVRRLERATDERRWSLVREILQALSQFPEADRATARALVAWVQRGGPPWRRPDLELKLEAVNTLGQLAGEHCTQALREIAAARLSPRICDRASRILDRRGDRRGR